MKFQEFVKTLLDSEAVDGYKLERVEIDVCVCDETLYVGGDTPCAKITITEKSEEVENG